MSYKEKPLSLLLKLPETEKLQATEPLAMGHSVLCVRQPFLFVSSILPRSYKDLSDSDEGSPCKIGRRAGGLRLSFTEAGSKSPTLG